MGNRNAEIFVPKRISPLREVFNIAIQIKNQSYINYKYLFNKDIDYKKRFEELRNYVIKEKKSVKRFDAAFDLIKNVHVKKRTFKYIKNDAFKEFSSEVADILTLLSTGFAHKHKLGLIDFDNVTGNYKVQLSFLAGKLKRPITLVDLTNAIMNGTFDPSLSKKATPLKEIK
ncbi:MAG: hypothetical protein WC741_05190 [Patescibacteria group bacterium]|jgi:hypothetical protein